MITTDSSSSFTCHFSVQLSFTVYHLNHKAISGQQVYPRSFKVSDTWQLCCITQDQQLVIQGRYDTSFVIIVHLQNTWHVSWKNKWKNPLEWSNLIILGKIDLKRRMTLSRQNVVCLLKADITQVFCHRVLVLKCNVPELGKARGTNKPLFHYQAVKDLYSDTLNVEAI